jgi:outer membrane protein TolC
MDLRLGLYQPLSALYAYNSIRSEFKKAQLNYELSLRSLKRAELDLIYETSQAFYDLVATKERQNIAAQVLEVQQEAYEIAQQKYDAGLIREVEALQMEVDLGEANNDYDLAVVAYESQLNYFKQKLGLSLQDRVSIVSDMTYKLLEIDEEFAVEQGLNNRMELREHEIQIELSQIELKRVKADRLIKGDILAFYDLIGTDQTPLPFSMSESVGNSWGQIQDKPGNFGVALSISVPIFDWGERKSLVRAAESGLETNKFRYQEERINIEREIRNTVKQLSSSLRRLQLLEKNVELAEKSFNISRQQFSNGDIDSQSLALDRTRLNAAYQSHLDAYISFKLLQADVMRKSFFDFENNVPIVVNY